MYEIGDKFDIEVRLDGSTVFDQNIIISYAFANIIITCGHCLPSNAIIPNGQILYTSGFDTPTENQEIGIIRLNHNINIKPKYKLTKTNELNKLINSNMIFNKQLSMINQSNSYNLNLIKIFDYESFNSLKFNELNLLSPTQSNPTQSNPTQSNPINKYYLIHSINKILSKTNNIFNIFNISKVGVAYSEARTKPLINSDLKLINQIAKNNKWTLETNIVYYVSEPSYSGSPCILRTGDAGPCILTADAAVESGPCILPNNITRKATKYPTDYFVGYHLGSTLGFEIREEKIIKIYKMIYFKFLSID